jgi:hypothetical protein
MKQDLVLTRLDVADVHAVIEPLWQGGLRNPACHHESRHGIPH